MLGLMMNFSSFLGSPAFMDQLLPFAWLLVPLAMIDFLLKAWALWRSARMNKIPWFIVLLLLNTFGILPAVFLFITNEEYKRNHGAVRHDEVVKMPSAK
jgi:hypothetical protein